MVYSFQELRKEKKVYIGTYPWCLGMCSALTQLVRAVLLHCSSVVSCKERKNNDAKNYRKAEASGSILSADVKPPLTVKCLWWLFQPWFPTQWYTASDPDQGRIQYYLSFRQ
jgi:hypothetical protein